MSETSGKLAIRELCRDDLDRLFNSRSRRFGERWLVPPRSSEVYVAVAELDGVAVGRVSLDFARHAADGVAYLWAAHVEQEHRSKGIGTALCLHLEQVAREHGFPAIQLGVDKENLRAQRLYHRLGYEVCGEEIDRWSYREDDRLVETVVDCWTMRKQLGAPGASLENVGASA